MAAGLWQGDNMAAMIFTTTEYATTLQDLARRSGTARLVLNINPQWSLKGQVVSDFGFGSQARARKDFVDSFVPVFHQSSIRVFGDRVAILRAYPGHWHLFYCKPGGAAVLMAADAAQPSFARLTELMRQQMGSRTSMSWLERLREPLLPAAPSADSASLGSLGAQRETTASTEAQHTATDATSTSVAQSGGIGGDEAARQAQAERFATKPAPCRQRSSLADWVRGGEAAAQRPRGYGLGSRRKGSDLSRDELDVAPATTPGGDSVETAILRNQVSAAAKRIEQLTAERDALEAQVRRLRQELADATGVPSPPSSHAPEDAEAAAREFGELLRERTAAS